MAEDLKNSDFLEELTKLVIQINDLFNTSGCGPQEIPDKPALTAGLMAAFSAALAATASKSGVWCKNINQNGVANNSFINSEHKINLEDFQGRFKEVKETEIITVNSFKDKGKKDTPLEEMELELLEL
ncbi:hypothetical protein [Desulfocucumis palustris]|nr:hypothetical protein [Desulfocucumis palustris]